MTHLRSPSKSQHSTIYVKQETSSTEFSIWHDLPCYTIIFHGMPCFPCYTITFHGMPWSSMVCHVFSWYAMLFHGMPHLTDDVLRIFKHESRVSVSQRSGLCFIKHKEVFMKQSPGVLPISQRNKSYFMDFSKWCANSSQGLDSPDRYRREVGIRFGHSSPRKREIKLIRSKTNECTFLQAIR